MLCPGAHPAETIFDYLAEMLLETSQPCKRVK